jgi:hypothetical protein
LKPINSRRENGRSEIFPTGRVTSPADPALDRAITHSDKHDRSNSNANNRRRRWLE